MKVRFCIFWTRPLVPFASLFVNMLFFLVICLLYFIHDVSFPNKWQIMFGLCMSHPGGDPEHAHETQNTLESLSQLAWEHDLDQW